MVTSQSSRAAATACDHRAVEPRGVGDDVVGRERTHDDVLAGLVRPTLEHGRRQPDRRHRVARRRLGQHRVGPERRQLRADRLLVRTTGHDQEPVLHQRRQPVVGLLQQGAALAGEVVEELGRRRSRQRPESGAGTSGRNHRPERVDRAAHHVIPPSVRCRRPGNPRRRPGGGSPPRYARAPPILGTVLTFAAVLADRLRREPGRPLVTFYDDATGERVELSVTTYANWVAKAGSLLVDELGLERGDTLRIDLPPHWLTPVFLGAAWSAGPRGDRRRRPGRGRVRPRGARPLGGRRGRARRTRLLAAAARRPVRRAAAAGRARRGRRDLVAARRVHAVGPADGRRSRGRPGRLAARPSDSCGKRPPPGLSSPTVAASSVAASPASPPELATFVEPLAKGGSLVLVTRAGPERLEAIAAAEHTTARFPA